MQPDSLIDWLKIIAMAPALIAAYKLPAGFRWMRNRMTQMLAESMVAQLMPTLQELKQEVGEVRKQVFPNGGLSISDRLNRVLDTGERTERNLVLLRSAMRAHQDADLQQARFEADDAGRFTWVSHAFLRWCNRGMEQVIGAGWVNCIGLEDRDRVREEWATALSENREFSLRFLMRDIRGHEFPVEAYAKPLRGGGLLGEPEQWIGVITKVS